MQWYGLVVVNLSNMQNLNYIQKKTDNFTQKQFSWFWHKFGNFFYSYENSLYIHISYRPVGLGGGQTSGLSHFFFHESYSSAATYILNSQF